MPLKMYYVINARMPNLKAYGIHLAKSCEGFVEAGVDLTLVIPRLKRTDPDIRGFYHLGMDVPVVVLPALDWYDRGRALFFLSSLVFMVSTFFFLMKEKWYKRLDVIYTIDTDIFSFAFLPLIGVPYFVEIHGMKPNSFLCRFLFRRARGIITLNSNVRDSLSKMFGVPLERFIIDPCGVEAAWFSNQVSQSDARRALSLPADAKIAVYAGRFYTWKGLEIIPEAFAHLSDVHCYLVGDSREEFQRVTNTSNLPKNLHFIGLRPFDEIPRWHAVADVLMVPWPKTQDAFHEYMSPMKIFECLAARRPLVAANHPTITSLIGGGETLLYEPGNAIDFAEKIQRAILGGPQIEKMVAQGFEKAKLHTNESRTVRITAFINTRLKTHV